MLFTLVFSTIILTSSFHSVTSSTVSALSHLTLDIHNSTKHHISTIHNSHPTSLSHPTFLSGPTRTNLPVPFHTGATPQSQDSQQSGQKPIFVVFEVLGGLLASGLLIGLGRCCYQYRNTPKRDRIAEVVNRHNLQRELEEIERNPQILRRHLNSLREPAPPYYPAPPSYEVTSSPTIIAGTNYADMDTRNLHTPSPQTSILIPPRPAG